MRTIAFISLLFVLSGTVTAGELSRKDAEHFLASMQLTPEYRERFYGAAEPGFEDLIDLISRKKKTMFERSKVRGITNSQEIVYLAHEDGTYTVIAPMHSVAGWMGMAPETGVNLFEEKP